MSKVLNWIKKKSKELTVFDWVLFAVFAVFFFFATDQGGDLLHTGSASFALLQGHIKSFYGYVSGIIGGCSYLISTYILFAIWNIPLAILGYGNITMAQPYWVLMWFKGLPTLLFFLSAVLMYKICKRFEKDSGINAKWGVYLFLTTSVAFYSQFMFGQYDIMTVFFMLLGINELFKHTKRSELLFSLFFGIAATFKYHALLFYVPILLYHNKQIFKLIKHAVLFGIPVLLVVFPYKVLGSGSSSAAAFSSSVEGFGALDYVFSTSVEYYRGGLYQIYLVPLIWVVICAKAFLAKRKTSDLEVLADVNYYLGFVVWIAFGIIFWHPQWLMLAAPFLALSVISSNRKDFICLIDIVLSYAFMAFVVVFYPGLTENFYSYGAFQNIINFGNSVPYFTLASFYPFTYEVVNIIFTAFSGILLGRAMLLKPEKIAELQEKITNNSEKIWMKARAYLGMAVIIVPMIICLISWLNAPYWSIQTQLDQKEEEITIHMESERDFEAVFFVIWSDENGQDDIIWHRAEKEKDSSDMNKWDLTIDLQEHKGYGKYMLHVYAGKEGHCRKLREILFTRVQPEEQPSF